jgi:hypothetical protein
MSWCGAGGDKSAAMAKMKRGARAGSAAWSRCGHGAHLASIRRLYASCTRRLPTPGLGQSMFQMGARSRWYQEFKTFLNEDNCLQLSNGSYVPFKISPKHYLVETALTTTIATGDDADLLHVQLGHFSAALESRLNETLNATYHSFSGIKHDPLTCEACMLNKRRRPACCPESVHNPENLYSLWPAYMFRYLWPVSLGDPNMLVVSTIAIMLYQTCCVLLHEGMHIC